MKFKKSLIIFIFVLLSCGSANQTNNINKQSPEKSNLVFKNLYSFSVSDEGTSITGKINNIEKAKSSFYDGTSLILFNYGEKTNLGLTKDGIPIIYEKNLPKTIINKDGTFLFEGIILEEGNYTVIVQPIRTTGNLGSIPLFDLTTKDGIGFNISKESPFTSEINLGNLSIGKPK